MKNVLPAALLTAATSLAAIPHPALAAAPSPIAAPSSAAARSSAAAPAVSATAQVYDEDSRLLAEARFDAPADAFTVTKRITGTERAYLEYRYTTPAGAVQTGTQWGSRAAGETLRFRHDFAKGRQVTFRVCLEGDHPFNPCSGADNGENWTLAIA
ncbi:hypothetical protein ACWT_4244 [Actinoplanes sp. SE50]|uniref:hypothetical protein n=1 Tax=unclassified Actinoplanes TaxID=2626549 RepID=UPI00023EC49C|nr:MULTISPECIES: hypothetical protein [unclassified Actinoplanes]AEV85264.1 hypothetical protein ACPL_4373 [Actinoplanes sp. SE50/110]ATO83659.1 hypothetical protein ACWT_4244 [Actinoplanes sp. SE50]SLM01067.1 hypothetical protein ACSP50_4300 [Actinoplanes sp. SE50/110]